MESLAASPVLLGRRALLQAGAFASAGWLTATARLLAREADADRSHRPAQSVIMLWLAGGPSQLETFDPHPGRAIGGLTRGIRTAAAGVTLADGLERLADRMDRLSLVRSLVSKEGDHERGTYLIKTGYRPDPTLVHPAIGAICCHELPAGGVDIPRHVSILPGQWPARGGFLGARYDAFLVDDPLGKLPDAAPHVEPRRYERRLADLAVVERVFAGRRATASGEHAQSVAAARRMMTSEQLAAFDVSGEPRAVRDAYGQTPFGRGCLAARRLIEVGVRCVEVTLGGWDTHVNNHESCRDLKAVLDPAIAALCDDLVARDLWRRTVVICGGEFGRTPRTNPLGGRDHWPHGFSMLLGGGQIRGGQAIGATDPDGSKNVHDPRDVADIHATVLAALGLNAAKENVSPIGRPIKLSDGRPMRELLG